ncbi:MAG: hypothetical protein HY244_03630 [Rhizobiales bacterium]|nr:hypothetical protein [Hyphomicrobiales bacterium]
MRAAPIMEWFGAPAPFPSTLRWLYAASLCYALGILLYQLFCPSEIKRFGSPEEFVKDQHELFLRANPQRRLEIVLARLDPVLDADVIKRIEALTGVTTAKTITAERIKQRERELEELILSLHADAVQKYLLTDYDTKDISRFFPRWGSFLLYVAGSLLVLTLLGVRSYDVFFDRWGNTVLIKSSISTSTGDLELEATTFSEMEFAAVEDVLRKLGIEVRFSPLEPKPRDNRERRRYNVSHDLIPKLENALSGHFLRTGEFQPSPTQPGSVYACEEVKLSGRGKGCEELAASDMAAARVKCGLVANSKKWFGGVPRPGTCGRKSSWW